MVILAEVPLPEEEKVLEGLKMMSLRMLSWLFWHELDVEMMLLGLNEPEEKV